MDKREWMLATMSGILTNGHPMKPDDLAELPDRLSKWYDAICWKSGEVWVEHTGDETEPTELLALRSAVVDDAAVERAARSLCATVALAMGNTAPDPDEMAFEGEREIGPIWACYKDMARAALNAAASQSLVQS